MCDEEPRSIVNVVRDVPLNLQIPLRVLEEGEAAPRLERFSDGSEVPATVEQLSEPAGVWWLSVDEDLEPLTDYAIVREGGVEAVFKTGDARDEEPPRFDAISAQSGGNEALCGPSVGGVLTLSGAADPGESFNVWLELEVIADGRAQVVFTDYSNTSHRLSVGASDSGCFGALTLPSLPPGAAYGIRARLHDAAGNVSELRSTELNPEASEPGGCGEPSGTAGAGGAGPEPEPPEPDVVPSAKGGGCAVAERGGGSLSWVAAGVLVASAFWRRAAAARRALLRD